MKIYSERFPIKYLFSEKGICLGVDTKKRSFLFILSSFGIMIRKRPMGDKVVESLDYEIDRIYCAIKDESKLEDNSS